jgi:hypothetical protein
MAISLEELKGLAYWQKEINPRTDTPASLALSARLEAEIQNLSIRNPRIMLGLESPQPLDQDVWNQHFKVKNPPRELFAFAIDGTIPTGCTCS